ncbi:hypothetical protein AMK26_20355 [Streptomyces sp. CB03234]|uniref:hypothetical protein n=1 Tax=Streptomyces sp. (strain CB03234) TaxID=1703937 RepID=UPI00093D01CF|nr:hypothetical protein [Streptomyces sp. CB03234]OKK03772.1 hypothetical protein AMK26_20355 [Streptomyces sp. CB03234]
MKDRDHKPETAAEELLDEFEEAELRLDDGGPDEHDKEAADTLTPSETGQESVQNDKHRRDGKTA